MKKLLFVFNPKSGKAQIRNHLMEILDIFVKAGYEVQVHVTQARRDAWRVAAQYGETVDLLVCSGGDGTLNETICGLMELAHPPLLGYIPAGSTNDFAASLKIPKSMKRAAMMAVDGQPYAIDIGRFCEDRHFVYVAGFGAFTEVSYMTSQEMKNLMGHPAYVLEGVKSLTGIKTYQMRLACEELDLEGEFIFGMVTNTISVGGFKGLVHQDVALNDGYFEVLLIRAPKSPMDLSNIVSNVFLKEESNEFVYRFKTRALKVISEEPVDWVLDGEFGGTKTEVFVENLQNQIQIKRYGAENALLEEKT